MKGAPAPCNCCGRTEQNADVRPVSVEGRDGSDRRHLPLCRECRSKDGATWRLKWRLLGHEVAA